MPSASPLPRGDHAPSQGPDLTPQEPQKRTVHTLLDCFFCFKIKFKFNSWFCLCISTSNFCGRCLVCCHFHTYRYHSCVILKHKSLFSLRFECVMDSIPPPTGGAEQLLVSFLSDPRFDLFKYDVFTLLHSYYIFLSNLYQKIEDNIYLACKKLYCKRSHQD